MFNLINKQSLAEVLKDVVLAESKPKQFLGSMMDHGRPEANTDAYDYGHQSLVRGHHGPRHGVCLLRDWSVAQSAMLLGNRRVCWLAPIMEEHHGVARPAPCGLWPRAPVLAAAAAVGRRVEVDRGQAWCGCVLR
jgi:hypothetical protein